MAKVNGNVFGATPPFNIGTQLRHYYMFIKYPATTFINANVGESTQRIGKFTHIFMKKQLLAKERKR